MGTIRVRARTIGLILLSAHFASAAAAAERVSMPFDCRYDGARVDLAPSAERSYTILGPHQSEIFSACSPADPNRCRSWFVHRFEMDCNGARVAWADVAAAAMRYYGKPGWVENGRFHLRMGPLWTFEGRSAFREGQRRWLRERDEPDDRFGRYDEDGRSYRDGRIVTLPDGFAPAQGIPVAFSGAPDAPASAQAVVMPPPSAVRTAPPPVAEVAPPKPEPIPALPERAPRLEIAAAMAAAQPAPAAVAASPKEQPEAAPTRVAMADAAKPAPVTAEADDEEKAEPASKPPALTIINGPQSQKQSQETQPEPQAEETSEQSVANEVAEAPIVKSAEAATSDISTGSTKAPAHEDVVAAADPVPTSLAPAPPAPDKTIVTPVTVAAALALALAALAATMGFRRRTPELVHVTPPSGRDYGSISLGGLRSASSPPPALGGSLALQPEAPPVAALSPAPSDSLTVAPDFPVPSSYEQALDVLGVSPDASLAAIKKIVDGLRQSWHPDHARSEPDRLYRESRSRQINVAWDLVSEHRSAA